jgi:hypothetical protein
MKPICTIIRFLCLVALTTLSGCSDDITLPETSPQGVLTLSASLQDYNSTTRTVDIDYSTKFTDGDDMGILGIRDGKVISDVCNIRATYNGTDWTTDIPIKKYSGVTYIAYAPYKSDLSTTAITCADDIVDQLSVPEQGTYSTEEYKAHDHLIATEGTITEDVLKFTFTHAFGMLEIVLPRTVYKMSQKGGTSTLPNYYIREAECYYISDNGFKMCETSPNAYRCLVPPGKEVRVYGGYKTFDGRIRDFRYSMAANTLRGGQCRSVVVDRQEIIDFEYEQGDFFLADGSLVEKDDGLTDEQKEQCIGLVFYANSSSVPMGDGEKEVLNSNGIGAHGYVVALRDAYDPITGDPVSNKMWGPMFNIEDLDNSEGLDDYLTDYSGLSKTQAMMTASAATSYYTSCAAHSVALFEQEVPAPNHTTGWFIPSVGQWVHMIEKLANVSVSSNDFTVHSWSTDSLSYQCTFSTDVVSKIDKKFKKAGNYDTLGSSYWTSVELSDYQAVYITVSGSILNIFEAHKGSGGKKVRCFLAF